MLMAAEDLACFVFGKEYYQATVATSTRFASLSLAGTNESTVGAVGWMLQSTLVQSSVQSF